MYQRHSASSTGSTEMQGQQHQQQQQQQSYPFKRPTPSVTMDRRSSSSSQINNNDISNLSFSSLPDVDQNYYSKNDSNNNNNDDDDKDDDYDYDYDDNKYNKRSGHSYTFNSNKAFFFWRILPCLILLTAPWIPCHFVRRNVKSKKAEIETIIREQKGLVVLLDETTSRIKKLKSDIEMISKDNELSYQELRRSGKRPEDLAAGSGEKGKETTTLAGTGTATDMESTEYEEMEEQEEVLVQRIDALEKSIQKSAAARLKDRYGNGQCRFKVNVRDQKGDLSWFVIETAMLDEMPHAIDHFSKMVEKRLWDGLALVHEPHSLIVTATPMTMDEGHTWAGQRFADANLTHMAFTEHSSTYPPPHHRLYTVAFSGRPGGPSFYISLDNELDFAHEQESTFGVVMEGRDVLYQFFLQKDINGLRKILTIESIDILQTKKPTKEE